MKHKGLIALAAIFAAGIVLTTFTSQILGVKEPVGTVMITNEADTEGVPMAGRAAAQAAIDEDPASQGQKTAAEEAGVAVYGLDAGADGASAPGGEAGDGTMSRKMAQDEAARPEMAMEESPDADGEAVSISPLDPEPALTGDSDDANIEMELTDGSGNSSYYRNRLALADSELKLWDNELNLIYNAVKDDLDDGEAADLVEEERAWIRERDRKAIDAAKASAGGSLESVEDTASLADSTRERAYELLDRYEDRIQ